MIFYQHEYKIQQKLEPTFNYFLEKEYLLKYLKKAAPKRLFFRSKDENTLIRPGEIVYLYSPFGGYFTELEIHILDITKYSKITTKRIPGNVYYDNWSIDQIQSDQFKEKTPITIDKIQFKQKQEYIEVIETAALENTSWSQSIYWKMIGSAMQFINKKKHHQIKEEIESLTSAK